MSPLLTSLQTITWPKSADSVEGTPLTIGIRTTRRHQEGGGMAHRYGYKRRSRKIVAFWPRSLSECELLLQGTRDETNALPREAITISPVLKASA